MRSFIPGRRQALVFGSLDGSIEAQAIDPRRRDRSSRCAPGRVDMGGQLVDGPEPGLPDKAAERGHPSYVWRAGQERRFEMVGRWAPLRNRRVLDVGCGMGLYTDAFRRETPHAFGVEIEYERARRAAGAAAGIAQATGERLPFSNAVFDVVFSHEVLEHVADDRICAEEMVRVARPGGRIVIFVPNRLYGFETHGVFWRGRYRFGNVPGVNWLPKRLRDRLAPHVRAYTGRDLRRLLDGLPVRVIHHTQVYPGYDNVAARAPALGRLVRSITYALEGTPLRVFGLSHLLVLERVPA